MRKLRLTIAAILSAFAMISCNNEASEQKETKDTASQQASVMVEENTSYSSDSVTMNGYVVYDDKAQGPRPAVLVVHEWWGNNDYSKRRAKELADLGYVAMAVDMYGNGQTAANPEEAMKLAGPFYADPQMAKSRLDAALAKLKSYPQVDSSKIAAIGYCFGGTMVMNAAKLGADLDGVVSFHGGLQGPAPSPQTKAHFLVCHGAADSFISDEDSTGFRKQLDQAKVNYEFKSYPNAKHAFTNPDATANGEKFKIDIAYNAEADKNSWNDMKAFLEKIFK